MTRFLTIDEFTARIGVEELAQIAGLGSFNAPEGRTLDTEKIESAITFAGDLLVAHARARYREIEAIAVEATPDLVKGFVTDIARYRLRSRSGGQGQVSEEVRTRYEDALAFFRDVARGKAELPIGGAPIDGEIAAGVAAIIEPARAPAALKGW